MTTFWGFIVLCWEYISSRSRLQGFNLGFMTAPWELDGILMLMLCGSDMGLFACKHIACVFSFLTDP